MAELNRRVIFEGVSKKGKKFVVRYPAQDDVKALCGYINNISKEKTFLRWQGETIAIEDEEKYLNNQLQRIKNNISVHLIAFCNEELIGNVHIDMQDKSESHVGVLGITISKDFRDEGIGGKLLNLILKEASKHMPQLRIITLAVLQINEAAQKMYKKLGFREYGRLPKGSTHRNSHVDVIYMYKNIRG
jgi:ribosomal protein S18 acetylase RimI-like enzyme